MVMTVKEADTIENGATIFIPLNKLKRHPKNARKTPHSEASLEAKAASIAAKGMLQNLVVEPELDGEGQPTGFYLVSVGEGRRLAQLLRVKRKEIRKTEPIRCVIDTANDPAEISLDENVTREDLHPADQFERFRELAEHHGWGAEEIAARFGVSANVVRQRLRLGAVSPKLMQAYRDGDLNLDQLTAFAITEDYARQEQVYGNLSYNREPYVIRRMMTETLVPATDRRAFFIGVDAYLEAGGTILRDLFTEDRGGFFEDAALLDRLVIEKLERITAEVQAEGWNWSSAHIDFPHDHGFRRVYPQPVELSEEDAAAFAVAQEEYDRLSLDYEGAEELPPDVDERFAELEGVMERIDAKRYAYDAGDIARGGVLIALSHDGMARIERGYLRPEDEQSEHREGGRRSKSNKTMRVTEDGEIVEDDVSSEQEEEETGSSDVKSLPDSLNCELTAYRTLSLRLAVDENPDMALTMLTHALAAQVFYDPRGRAQASCLDLKLGCFTLSAHAPGIEDTKAAIELSARHENWARDMPEEISELWAFVSSLDADSRLALLAHCVSLSLRAIVQPWERKPIAEAQADDVAQALSLDMTAIWQPTARSYFSRITKSQIIEAVREAAGDEAAARIAGMKKQAMAEAAEALVAGTGWLPKLLRRPVARPADNHGPSEAMETEGAIAIAEGQTLPSAAE